MLRFQLVEQGDLFEVELEPGRWYRLAFSNIDNAALLRGFSANGGTSGCG